MWQSEWFNLILGACALWYSFMPAAQVRSYRREVALLLRIVGGLLILLAGTSLILRLLARS